jgi:hypothetical protein
MLSASVDFENSLQFASGVVNDMLSPLRHSSAIQSLPNIGLRQSSSRLPKSSVDNSESGVTLGCLIDKRIFKKMIDPNLFYQYQHPTPPN